MFGRFLISLVLSAGMAQAESIAFDGSWKHQKLSLFSSNSFSLKGSSLGVESNGAVSLIYRPLGESGTQASWRWSVGTSVPATDLTRKGGDDRNLALYFVFLPENKAAALRGKPVRQVLKSPDVRALVYVWGGKHARGAVLPSPYLDNRGKTIVLRGNGTGKYREKVDLATDFKRAFGRPMTRLTGVAVSADSDDTNSRVRARISDFRVD